MIAAVEGGPSAPSTAAGHGAVDLDDEVRSVIDELAVNAHDRFARLDLRVVEVVALQLLDGRLHQWDQDRHVIGGGQSDGGRNRSHLRQSHLEFTRTACTRQPG